MSSRKVSEAKKKNIAGRQFYRCANEPGKKLRGLTGYECPLWCRSGKNQGVFDESGYDIDHIKEYCISANDSVKNLQALCKTCHNVKTKRFAMRDKKSKSKEDTSSSEDVSSSEDISSSEEDEVMTSKINNKKKNVIRSKKKKCSDTTSSEEEDNGTMLIKIDVNPNNNYYRFMHAKMHQKNMDEWHRMEKSKVDKVPIYKYIALVKTEIIVIDIPRVLKHIQKTRFVRVTDIPKNTDISKSDYKFFVQALTKFDTDQLHQMNNLIGIHTSINMNADDSIHIIGNSTHYDNIKKIIKQIKNKEYILFSSGCRRHRIFTNTNIIYDVGGYCEFVCPKCNNRRSFGQRSNPFYKVSI